MRYPDFACVPMAILSAGLVVVAIGQRVNVSTLLHVLDAVGGVIWSAILMYVAGALLRPPMQSWGTT